MPGASSGMTFTCPFSASRVLGFPTTAPDALIWRTCQQEGLVLITGNRNDDGADSLEATIRSENQPESLPVLTIADANRVLHERVYADSVAESVLDYLLRIDEVRGAGAFTFHERRAETSLSVTRVDRPIDGNDDRQPGGDYIATISGSRVTIGGLPLARTCAEPTTVPDEIDALPARGALARLTLAPRTRSARH